MPIWYEAGVRFSCQRCRACCLDHGEATAVFLQEGEPVRIARVLRISEARFLREYTRACAGIVCLVNRGDACVFLSEEGCTVHRARPLQCATWPFWPENLDPAKWASEVLPVCPGVGKGRLYDRERIEKIAARMKYARPLWAEWNAPGLR
jgi:uncharacterized protein